MEIGFWFFMLIMVLLTPLAMVILGKNFEKSPPKEINSSFGYRTRRSMQNQETWDFAHQEIGKLWFKLGVSTLFLSVGAMFFPFGKSINYVSFYGLAIVVIQIIAMIATIFLVERELKENF